MKEHKYANELRALANGEEIESRYNGDEEFRPLGWYTVDVTSLVSGGWDYEFRIKPHTIKIGDHEIPEPMREAPEMGTYYFLPYLFNTEKYVRYKWYGNTFDSMSLRDGLCHATEEAAITHAEALIAFTEKKK